MKTVPHNIAALFDTVRIHSDDTLEILIAGEFSFFFRYEAGVWTRRTGGHISGICDIPVLLQKAQEADEVMETLKLLAA
jgi:hypothetical protein